MPFLKALLLRCFLPLRFRDMRLISRRARRRASSSDGGSLSEGGFGIGGPPPRVSLTASSFLNAFRASFTFLGGPGRSLNSFLATCSASFLSRMTCVIVALDAVETPPAAALRVALSGYAKSVSGHWDPPRRRRQGRRGGGAGASLGCPTPAGREESATKLPMRNSILVCLYSAS